MGFKVPEMAKSKELPGASFNELLPRLSLGPEECRYAGVDTIGRSLF